MKLEEDSGEIVIACILLILVFVTDLVFMAKEIKDLKSHMRGTRT